MLAVNVTGSPNTLGLADEVTFMTMSALVAAGGGGGFTTAQGNASFHRAMLRQARGRRIWHGYHTPCGAMWEKAVIG